MTAKRKKSDESSKWKWIAAGAGVAALLAAWRFLPLADWLQSLEGWISGMGVLGGFVYGAVYVLATLLLVPGSVLTIVAAYLFGIAGGMAVVWPSATAAAALGFLGSRYVAREHVERLARRHPKFDAVDAAIGKNGWKVVGLLRFSPVVPFALSNYLFGVTSVAFWPFLAASSFGILPGTLFYLSLGAAGKSLSEKGELSAWEWALLAAGLLATAAAAVILTRYAKKELESRRVS
jgi:uncharacterized membrane protein YdjX (TVP38/TMEM64 family)